MDENLHPDQCTTDLKLGNGYRSSPVYNKLEHRGGGWVRYISERGDFSGQLFQSLIVLLFENVVL